MANTSTKERYEAAVEAFVERARADRQVLAVILFGSLAYDAVWERSDLDLLVVTADQKAGARTATRKGVALIEDDIVIHASVQPRAEFRQEVEGALRSSFVHSIMVRSRLVFCRDPSLEAVYEGLSHVGARDRQIRLLDAASILTMVLTKARKFLTVKGDARYAYLWLSHAIQSLAKVEVMLHGGIPGREVIQEAIQLNPTMFRPIYEGILDHGVTATNVLEALQTCEGYLLDHTEELFGLVLEHLATAGVPISAGDLDLWAKRELGLSFGAIGCEWLADQGLVTRVSQRVRLTPSSSAEVDELAFYYDR